VAAVSEGFVIQTCIVLIQLLQRVTDKQTDRHTETDRRLDDS